MGSLFFKHGMSKMHAILARSLQLPACKEEERRLSQFENWPSSCYLETRISGNDSCRSTGRQRARGLDVNEL